jgi:hypothetical protein
MSSPLLRSLAPLTILGGACWVAFAISNLVAGETSSERVDLSTTGDYVGFGLFSLCLALSVPALAALHLYHRGADGRLGRAGAIVAVAGAAAQCVVITGIVVNGEETSWFGVGAPLAILTWVVGSVLLGVAISRAHVMPRWTGVALPLVTVFAIVGANAGTSVLIGAFQIVIGGRLARASSSARATELRRAAA